MIRKLKIEAEKFMSETGYGKGSNFTTGQVSTLMARFATEVVNKNVVLPDVINCAFKAGENVIVFNDTRWRKTGDLREGNDVYFQKAKILKLRYSKEWLADVKFESGQISNGHFVRGIKHCL